MNTGNIEALGREGPEAGRRVRHRPASTFPLLIVRGMVILMWFDINRTGILGRTRCVLTVLVLGNSLLVPSGCRSNSILTHEGVRYEIERDRRWHRVENDSDTFSYDSPELSVTVSAGNLVINSESCGPVKPGDHVQITSIGTVLVNGERRGDTETGKQALDQRLKVAKAALESHQAAAERVQRADATREAPNKASSN